MYSRFIKILTFCSFNFLLVLSVNGQVLREMNIEQIKSSSLVVFAEYPKNAAVQIQSTIQGLTVESNLGIVANQSNPSTGVYRYILLPGRQVLTISASGFLSARFETGNLNQREVLQLRITPKTNPSNNSEPISRGSLTIISEPDSALVTINGLPGNFRTPANFSDILAIDYSIRVEKPGYETKNISVNVMPNKSNTYEITLEPINGLLKILGLYDEFYVYESIKKTWDKIEKTNNNIYSFKSGSYSYSLKKKYSLDLYNTFSIFPNDTTIINPNWIPNYATIKVYSNAPSIRLTAENNDAPQSKIDNTIYLKPGSNIITVSADGYEDYKLYITTRGGQLYESSITMQKIKETPKPIISTDIVPKTNQKNPTPITNSTGFFNKNKAIALSVIIPGSGHIYFKENRGTFYLLSFLASGAFALYSYDQTNKRLSEYETTYNEYKNTKSVTAASILGKQVISKYDMYAKQHEKLRYATIVTGAIYSLQFIDIISYKMNKGMSDNSYISASAGVNKYGIQYNFNIK